MYVLTYYILFISKKTILYKGIIILTENIIFSLSSS